MKKLAKMKKKADEMTFWEHLGELRRRIFYSVGFLFVGFVAAWSFVDRLFYWLSLPVMKFLPALPGGAKKLAYTSLTEPFMMYMKISFIAAIFLTSPFIFHQLWLFITPALYPKEKRWVFPFVFFTTIFFLLGGAFGYFVVFPFACKFFLGMGKDFVAIITIEEYFSMAFKVLLGIGVVFELPVLVFLLAKLRLITARFLIKYFKYAVVLIFVLAAVITPTPDVITQSLFAVPMMFLYLLGVLIAWLVNPGEKEAKKQAQSS